MSSLEKKLFLMASAIVVAMAHSHAVAARPSTEDAKVYSSLCNTGHSTEYAVSASAKAPLMDFIVRRLVKGEVELSASALQDQFPKISNEKNLLQAIQTYQNCVYRYVENFHGGVDSASKPNPASNSVVAPSVPLERRREIVYLVSQLDDFKSKMRNVIANLPETYYDKQKAREIKPRQDMRIVETDNYKRYRAFEGPDGLLDFSNATNNDLSIMCDTFGKEVREYAWYASDYGVAFNLHQYSLPQETSRICRAAQAAR